MIRASLNLGDLSAYLAVQVTNLFPDGPVSPETLRPFVNAALERTEYSFSRIKTKYYSDGEITVFDHLNTNHYASFLYFVSNSIFRENGDIQLAKKVFGLNKALHGVDIFFEVEMPDVFLLVHPVGAVLGRARYGNFLCVYQSCSVGANLDDVYPTFGDGVILYGGSRVSGNSQVGNNCIIAPNAVVIDAVIPPNTITFGLPPGTVSKSTRHNVIAQVFGRTE